MALGSLNTDVEDEYADLSADELTIYFSSTRPGGVGIGTYDIYQATRPSISAPFANLLPVSGVNTSGDERAPRVTADGLSMFAISVAPGDPGHYHVTLATRANTAVAFDGLQPVANVNSTSHNDIDPYLLPAGDVLYVSSDRLGNFRLYRSVKLGGTFSAPKLVGGIDLDLPAEEGNPVVTLDELTLFFASTRPGGAGYYDIYEARRSTSADGFGEPIALASLNTAEADTPTWISPDGCDLYFTRFEPSAGRQMYVATRGP